MSVNLKKRRLDNWLLVSIALNFGSLLLGQYHPVVGGVVGLLGIIIFCVTVRLKIRLTRNEEITRETNRSR